MGKKWIWAVLKSISVHSKGEDKEIVLSGAGSKGTFRVRTNRI